MSFLSELAHISVLVIQAMEASFDYTEVLIFFVIYNDSFCSYGKRSIYNPDN